MSRHAFKLKLSVALLSSAFLVAGLSGCNNDKSTASLLAEAKQYQQKGDLKAAAIQLKNAVAKSPEDAEARLQLGMLHLEMGDPVSAEKELRKARSLGTEANRVLPLLGKAGLLQGRSKEVLEDITADQAKGSASLLTLRGDALLASGIAKESKAEYEAALAVDPNAGTAMLGLARHAMMNQDRDAALGFLADAMAKDPKNPDVWMAQAALLRMQGKTDEALAAYDEVLKLQPKHREAYVEKAYVEIGRGNFAAAKVAVEGAEKASPGNLLTVYVRALYEFSQGKYAAAHESLQRILKAAPDHMPTLLLAGASEMNLGSLQQAEQHLRKYVESNPNNVYARKLLAQTLLKSSQPRDAAAALAPVLKEDSQDAQLLALAGQSHMQVRDFSKASGYFEKAAELAPKAAGVRTSLGLSKLAQGDQVRGMKELELATALDPKSTEASLTLVQSQLGLKQYDEAMKTVLSMEKQQPNNPQVQTLKGFVYHAKGDTKSARVAFERAVTLQPTFFPAVSNLARLDLQEQNFNAAKQRFVKVLEADKNNGSAMAALGDLALVQKRPDEATSWFVKASDANPESINPALRLGMHYLQLNRPQDALNLTRKYLTTHPTNPDLLDLQGQAQLASKDGSAALETYSKLVSVLPKSAPAQLRMATANMMLKKESAAAENLKRAVELQPDFIPARLAQVDLAMRTSRYNEALSMTRELQKINSKLPSAYAIEGDVLLAQKKPTEAVHAYEKALANSESPVMLLKIVQALELSGKSKEAMARTTQWLKEHPNDTTIKLFLADRNLANREFKPAIALLEQITKQDPNNAIALNNLAWAYQQEKDPRALATAERAFSVAGESAGVMDTLGWILVEQGNMQRGVPLLKKAATAASGSPEIAYHLVVGLHKAGKRDEARAELDKLLATNQVFPQLEEARALRKTL
jgi:putative PEP-CTERM system TPR-repeat lipoprotein